MITFKQFISESINDKGILKAVFIIGLPGAGKSYTTSQLTGVVAPRVVNTDKAAEFLSTKWHKEIRSETWDTFKDTAHRMTSKSLSNYINSMLPLFVDGTSNDVSNLLHRMGILESLGYDVGVVFVHATLETAMKRASQRAARSGRHVDEDFIKKVDAQNKENAAYLKAKVDFYREVENDTDNLDDTVMMKAFKAVQSFFDSPVDNVVGQRNLALLKEKGEKYLAPTVVSQDVLDKKIQGWYKS